MHNTVIYCIHVQARQAKMQTSLHCWYPPGKDKLAGQAIPLFMLPPVVHRGYLTPLTTCKLPVHKRLHGRVSCCITDPFLEALFTSSCSM